MVAKFSVGERVIGLQHSRSLALFDIQEIYLNAEGSAVYKAVRCSNNSPEFVEEVNLSKCNGKYVEYGGSVWDIESVHRPVLTAHPGVVSDDTKLALSDLVEYLNRKHISRG
jgi:hypothetical protein